MTTDADTPGKKGTGDMFEQLYEELRVIAGRCMASEPEGHTLQTTALLNEVYIRLQEKMGDAEWSRSGTFKGFVVKKLRQTLVDYARKRRAQKRGGGALPRTLLAEAGAVLEHDVELLDLDDALTELRAMNDRHASVLELRYFGQFSITEIGEELAVSERTVRNDLRFAEAWMRSRLAAA